MYNTYNLVSSTDECKNGIELKEIVRIFSMQNYPRNKDFKLDHLCFDPPKFVFQFHAAFTRVRGKSR